MVIGIGRRQFISSLAGADRLSIPFDRDFSFRPHPQASLIYQRALIADDTEKWAKVIRAANIKG